MRTIRWGMIGCGDVTEVRSGPGFYKARNSTLVAVMRRNGPLAQDYAKRHNVPRWHDNADAIINDPDIDAVYIATLTDTHADYTLRCAAAGKAIYCEKPMAMTYAQCNEMIGAARSARVPLWVAFYRRALPRFQKLKQLIDEKAIGDVRVVMSRQFAPLDDKWATMPATDGRPPWRTDPARSGGGLFFETACHTLDSLDYLFGPIEEVRGFAANKSGAYKAEDTVTGTYRFASGVQGSGAWCYAADHAYEMNEIIGDKGRIIYSTTKPLPIRLHRGDSVEEFNVEDPPHVHQPLIQSIVDEMNGVGKCPSTGESAARTVWVMDRLLAEFYPGRDRGRIPGG
jgi:predicted dehydrogenase